MGEDFGMKFTNVKESTNTSSRVETYTFDLVQLPNLHGFRADTIEINAHELHKAFDIHGLQKVCTYLHEQVFTRYKL